MNNKHKVIATKAIMPGSYNHAGGVKGSGEINPAPKYTGNAILDTQSVDKYFKVGDQDVHILKNVNLKIETGDFVIIFGASGSGKSTLLHILLGLESPTNGKALFMGNDLYAGTDEDYRAEVRKKHIGMVYQQANWIKALNVIENIAFPLQLLGMEKSLALKRAYESLSKFELQDWAHYFPTELSSGQQQRIAMARAIVHNPMMIVADEPTGNLDYENGLKVMELLQELNVKESKTVIMVTHDLDYLAYAKTAVQIFDGEVVGIFRGKDKSKIEDEIKKRKQYSSKNDKSLHPDSDTRKKAEKTDIPVSDHKSAERSLAKRLVTKLIGSKSAGSGAQKAPEKKGVSS